MDHDANNPNARGHRVARDHDDAQARERVTCGSGQGPKRCPADDDADQHEPDRSDDEHRTPEALGGGGPGLRTIRARITAAADGPPARLEFHDHVAGAARDRLGGWPRSAVAARCALRVVACGSEVRWKAHPLPLPFGSSQSRCAIRSLAAWRPGFPGIVPQWPRYSVSARSAGTCGNATTPPASRTSTGGQPPPYSNTSSGLTDMVCWYGLVLYQPNPLPRRDKMPFHKITTRWTAPAEATLTCSCGETKTAVVEEDRFDCYAATAAGLKDEHDDFVRSQPWAAITGKTFPAPAEPLAPIPHSATEEGFLESADDDAE